MALTDLIGGSIGSAFKEVMSVFKVPPEVALQHEADMARIRQEATDKAVAAAQAEVEAASANIRADAQSGDKFTQRARPSFMYIVEFILAWNYIAAPLLGKPVLQLPDALFWLFGSAVLGYTGARTWEKFMMAPGDSSVELPLGFKARQNSNGGK